MNTILGDILLSFQKIISKFLLSRIYKTKLRDFLSNSNSKVYVRHPHKPTSFIHCLVSNKSVQFHFLRRWKETFCLKVGRQLPSSWARARGIHIQMLALYLRFLCLVMDVFDKWLWLRPEGTVCNGYIESFVRVAFLYCSFGSVIYDSVKMFACLLWPHGLEIFPQSTWRRDKRHLLMLNSVIL